MEDARKNPEAGCLVNEAGTRTASEVLRAKARDMHRDAVNMERLADETVYLSAESATALFKLIYKH